MTAALQMLNVRLPVDLLHKLEQIRKQLSKQLPGATRTDAVRVVIQRGLETLEEDKAWMGLDLSRLGEFEPYDFGEVDPTTIGTPVHHLSDGSFIVEKNS